MYIYTEIGPFSYQMCIYICGGQVRWLCGVLWLCQQSHAMNIILSYICLISCGVFIRIGIQTCRKTSTDNMHTRLGAQMTRHNISEPYSLLHNAGKLDIVCCSYIERYLEMMESVLSLVFSTTVAQQVMMS